MAKCIAAQVFGCNTADFRKSMISLAKHKEWQGRIERVPPVSQSPGWAATPDFPVRKYTDFDIDASHSEGVALILTIGHVKTICLVTTFYHGAPG
jgi:hypothetical protein